MKSKKGIVIAKDVPDFLSKIYLLGESDGVRCFRGEANRAWKTTPSIFRGFRQDAERNVISELTLESANDFDNDKSMFRRLVRAQHFGLPTRLLDVSLNPLVALFFACWDKDQAGQDGKVAVFDFKPGRIKFADSDAISIISNLANLSDAEKVKLTDVTKKFLNGNRDKDSIDEFNKIHAVDRLVQFVRVEKSYFRSEMDPLDIRKYFFVHPYKDNRRIIAQSGAFIIAGLLAFDGLKHSKGLSFTEVTIPWEEKKQILVELDRININRRMLFPEIESASFYIRERWQAGEENSAIVDDILGD